jgi:hypothetical protein
MIVGVVVLSIFLFIVLSIIALVAAYDKGYSDGQRVQRQQTADEMKRQELQAQRDIDYIYERAKKQISEIG